MPAAASIADLRVHPKLAVKRSIIAHGYAEPIELTPDDAEEYAGLIVDGAMRKAIGEELEIERVPVPASLWRVLAE